MVLEWHTGVKFPRIYFFEFYFYTYTIVGFITASVEAELINPFVVSNICFINNKGMHCPSYGVSKQPHQPSTIVYTKIMNRYHVPGSNYRSRLKKNFNVIGLPNTSYRKEKLLHPMYPQPFSYEGVDSVPSIKASPQFDYIQALQTIGHFQKPLSSGRRLSDGQKSMASQSFQPLYLSTSTRLTHKEDGSVSLITDKSTLNQDINVSSDVSTESVEIESSVRHRNTSSISKEKFMESLQQFERKFYQSVFEKLASISPEDRRENGISFVQSGLFLHLSLMTLYTEVDASTKSEIEACIGLDLINMDLPTALRNVTSQLPISNNDLKFRWSSRLVVSPGLSIDEKFRNGTASAMKLQINQLNGTEPPETLTTTFNQMVVNDSGGAMHNTFEEEELSQGVCAALLTTLYLRPRWRSAPTVLNGTWPFHNSEGAPGSARMIRINDVMGYVDLYEWNAEALQIQYATPHLSLLLLIPRGRSLRNLARHLSTNSLQNITDRIHTKRVAASIPLYTLRMTLLLPNKLNAMGLSSLITSGDNLTECSLLKLSHAVQRVMFWSEAGRNAFKDDGIEWDETPELELVVDRPYIFYVRWKNMTLMNGNFVL